MSRATHNRFGEAASSIGIAGMQEADNALRLAAETYEDTLRLAADLSYPLISGAHLGLGRILYEWNDLDAALQRGEQGLKLARPAAELRSTGGLPGAARRGQSGAG